MKVDRRRAHFPQTPFDKVDRCGSCEDVSMRAQMVHVRVGDAAGLGVHMRIERQAAAGDADAFVVGKHTVVDAIFFLLLLLLVLLLLLAFSF